MKTIIITLMIIVSGSNSSCTESNEISNTALELSEQEMQDLIFLREEEKLARDVYIYAYNKYQLNVFYNISQSEEQHMSSVLSLLNRYNLTDPVVHESGVFSNQDLQQLYNQLTTQVDLSLFEALKVGATIEDLDINDLNGFESNTEKLDILNVYNSLKCGSKNHLRSFVYQLDLNDVNYNPQFLSLDDYDAIIESDKERCRRRW